MHLTNTGEDLCKLKKLESQVEELGRVRVSFDNFRFFIFVVRGAPQGVNEISFNDFKDLKLRGDDVFKLTLLAKKFFNAKITKISDESFEDFQNPIIGEEPPTHYEQLKLW